ncbi:MAG TPA: sensor histidine kinase KdpD [Thermoleophilia bacterium]
MDDGRPDPDKLLEQIQADESRLGRGSLKIFFGYVAGVGKTYAMLEAAQRLAAEGVDVVAGYVEPHGRPATEALLEGLEILPPRVVDYRGLLLNEFDLDAALSRHPGLLLVDELAHTNAPGARHAKRWQDVQELLAADIDVYTTLNVQHLESINDIISQITGVRVRETVPDAVFDEADSVEIVDLPPRELRERLREGKIYIPAQAEHAMQNFFAGPNLGALREITLRRTADRVHAHVETSRQAMPGPRETWATVETLLVCIGPSPTSAKVIRTSKRLAASLNARWIAASVDTSRTGRASSEQRTRLLENVQLAERLGAETATLSGDDVAEEIVDYARAQNATKIVIGKTAEPRWRRMLRGSVVDDLLELSAGIDVYVIQGAPEPHAQAVRARPRFSRPVTPSGYLWALGAVVTAGLIAWIFKALGLAETNQAIMFLLAVAVVAARFGLGPGIASAIVGVLAFDFFFVPPRLTFAVQDVQYLITLVVMLAVALLAGTLAARVRRQVRTARSRERRLEALYRLSRELSAVSGAHQLAATAEREVSAMFGSAVVIYLPHSGTRLEPVVSSTRDSPVGHREIAVATWTFEHGELAGNGTDTLPDAEYLNLPMITPRATAGVLAVAPPEGEALLSPDNRQLLETVATQIGLAIERDELAEQTRCALVEMETERLRSSLLSSVSHDLRTPLAVISGASSTLLELGEGGDKATREELLREVLEESNRLARLVDNLLSMTRLDAGSIQVEKQWYPLEDVIGSAIGRLRKELAGRKVNKLLPPDLPLVPLDGVLIEQVLVNLMENAVRYTATSTPIDISAYRERGEVVIAVADRGPGLAEGEEERVFDKLFRGSASSATTERGVGLGLAIARAIVEAHGGRIWAENREGGGARFAFALPLEGSPPDLEMGDEQEAMT